jgi:ubiquinone/menaquinone biosynthesis C-methylase UbiE
MTHICPWWLAYSFDNSLRRLLHRPEEMLAPYVKEGMIVIDIGCGMGFFSIGMARLVGDQGLVISVDLQQKMLEVLERRAKKAGVAHRIRLHLCEKNNIGVCEEVDFALTFWMLHEVPDPGILMRQVYAILKPTARLLLVEPKGHVSHSQFQEVVASAGSAGFQLREYPFIGLSRAALLDKSTT